MTKIDIKEYTIIKNSSKIEIEIINYTLNFSAVVNVNFLDINDKVISSTLVYIDGDNFNNNWSSDNDLINIVMNKIGVSPI
jgi:hypothetical protein